MTRRPPARPHPGDGIPGTLYLVHFVGGALGDLSRPRMHARHYCGWTPDIDARIAEHRAGQGSRVTQAAVAARLGLELVWTGPGTRHDEAWMKWRGHFDRFCTLCQAETVIEAAAERGTLFA